MDCTVQALMRMRLLAPFARKLVVLLGEKDNDPQGKYLNRFKGAMAQGPHRLARGQNFDAEAKLAAKRLGVSYSWERRTIKSVGHDHRRMAKFAAKLFAPQTGCRQIDWLYIRRLKQ